MRLFWQKGRKIRSTERFKKEKDRKEKVKGSWPETRAIHSVTLISDDLIQLEKTLKCMADEHFHLVNNK